MKKVLGIDIGGTTIAIGIVNQNGDCEHNNVFNTSSFESAEILVNEIYNFLESNCLINEIDGIGIGAPNGNYYTGNIEFAPNLNWKGTIPIAKLFRNKFDCPTILTNDANAAAYGEMFFGNAKKLKDFIIITLGTGLGSGIVINRNLVNGHDGFAGELGHIRVVNNGRLCNCGRKGCLESYCSSTGLVRSFHEINSEHKLNSTLNNIHNIDSKEIVEHALQGDAFAMEIMEFTTNLLGYALADFACFSNPEAYILFGGYAQNGQFLADLVKKHMEDNLLEIYKNKIDVKISALHKQNAAILGAAAIVFHDNENK
jgi:glucokinase